MHRRGKRRTGWGMDEAGRIKNFRCFTSHSGNSFVEGARFDPRGWPEYTVQCAKLYTIQSVATAFTVPSFIIIPSDTPYYLYCTHARSDTRLIAWRRALLPPRATLPTIRISIPQSFSLCVTEKSIRLSERNAFAIVVATLYE